MDTAHWQQCHIMKLVHWPLMGGLLHLVQRGGDWAGPQPTQALLAVPNAHPSTASVQGWHENIN